MTEPTTTLASIIARIRAERGWTFRQMAEKTGLPVSTLGKVERGELTLTYDKLQQLSGSLGMPMAELFAGTDRKSEPQVLGRRCVGTEESAVRVNQPGYDHLYFCPEMRRKRMVPVVSFIRAKTMEEFGDLVRHPGEEFVYVVEGRVRVMTEFWDPIILETRQAIYIDSGMGHAYLAEGGDQAIALSVMSSGEDGLMKNLIDTFNGLE